MHGPETAKNLRQLGYANLIVAVTGNCTNQEDINTFLDAGADVVLCKPINQTNIMNLFEKFLS